MGTHTNRTDAQVILDAIRTLVRALRVSSRACETVSGRTSAQIFVLEQLASRRRLSVNELAEATFTHQSTASVVVSRLIKDGLVARTPAKNDARRIELSLTAKGARAHAKAPHTAQRAITHAIQAMTPAKRKKFGKLFNELVDEAGFGTRRPPLLFEDTAEGGRRRE